jgi:putative two-component system response regulator
MLKQPVLIVDDAPENLAAMRQILSDAYPLVFAGSGGAALAAARKHLPSLILLDIQLPDMSGYEVCRQLKSDRQTEDIPVVFVTSLSEVGDEAAGFDAGGVDYILKPVSPPLLLARVRNHLALVKTTRLAKSHREAISMLGEAGHFNDTDTGVHIWRMAAYARALANGLGWAKDDCERLELAAPMHDTGKLGVPQAILRKPGPLDEQEWAVMKSHTRIGHGILCKSEAPLFRLAAEISLRHHEKWNGLGYPDGLAGTDIPQSSRIVALADVFDALCMKRPYKEAWPIDKVVQHIEAESGTHFEPALVQVFKRTLPQLLDIQRQWGN